MRFQSILNSVQQRFSQNWPWLVSGGLIVAQFQPRLWLVESLSIGILLALAWLFAKRYRGLLSLLCLLIVGIVWGSFWGAQLLKRSLPESLVKQDIWVTGQILNLPQNRPHAVKFNFRIDEVEVLDAGRPFSGKVALSWYDQPAPNLHIGQSWRIRVRLKPAHGSMNPGAFDYEQYLFSQGIRATGYIRDADQASLIAAPRFRHKVGQLRARFKAFIDSQDLGMGGVLAALSIGERSGIDASEWKVFRDTGTAHLVAISGLHIGLVATMAYFISGFIWRHTFLSRTLYPTQHIARLSALIAALVYAALAGFALPTLRAFLMLLVYFCLQQLRRAPSSVFTLGFVLMCVLLMDPFAPLTSGAWLSFGAVAAIMLVIKGKQGTSGGTQETAVAITGLQIGWAKIKRTLRQWINIQWAVFVALMPASLLFFGQFSVVSLPANFLAIPLIGMLVVPIDLVALGLFALGSNSLASGALKIANGLLEAIWPKLQMLSDLPYSVWLGAAPNILSIAMALFGAWVLLYARFGRWRYLALLAWLPLFVPPHNKLSQPAFEIHALDVGQGLAIVVRTENHSLLYDAGIKYASGFDSGENIVLPFLKQVGISRLDTVIASHKNIDHYGGMSAVIDAQAPQQIYASAGFMPDSIPCELGQSWEWDGVKFAFIHPLPNTYDDENNDSCVLRVSSRFGSALLTGDIEAEAEAAILQRAMSKGTTPLAANVLLVPHHGSRTSSTPEFVQAVKPGLAIISAGFLNRFRHPHAQVSERYLIQEIPLLNTANTGQIAVRFGSRGIDVEPYRASKKSYWLGNRGHEAIFLPRIDE